MQEALAGLDDQITRLTDAIAVGGDLAGLVRALQEREERRRELQAELEGC